MPEAKFVLKEPKATSETLIYLFYNFNYDRLKYSTGEKIHPKFWNPLKQRAKESSQFKQHSEFNTRLNNIDAAINNAYRRLINDKMDVTANLLRKELDRELSKKPAVKKNGFLDWMENEIEIMKLDKKHGSIQVYNALLKHLKEFSKTRKYKLTFESINLEFYEQFKDYLFNEKKLLTNTFGKQITTLKTFLNIATEKGINTHFTYKSRMFKAMQEEIDHIHLNPSELEMLNNVKLDKKQYLDRVRDLFLIGCHTGLRFSDFTQLRKENLEKMEGGKYVFKVKTNKTGERVVIPVKPVLKKIWDKYKGELPRAISNQKMNEYLKELGELAGITQKVIIKKTSGKHKVEKICPKYELISTHTARRSFATNAFLGAIPAINVMKFTGHKTESSFMKYIKVSQEQNAQHLMDHPFFT
jgi:integrase